VRKSSRETLPEWNARADGLLTAKYLASKCLKEMGEKRRGDIVRAGKPCASVSADALTRKIVEGKTILLTSPSQFFDLSRQQER